MGQKNKLQTLVQIFTKMTKYW